MNNDHIELVFDGLYDRISGNETYASRYLGGVLWANEPSRMFVSGNEGFLDNVSDGIKKAWEYIKGIFKKIFGWFSSKSPEQKKSEIEKQSNSLKSDIERFLSSSDLKIAQRVYPRMIDAIKRDEGFPNRSAILAEVERLQSISPKISLGEIGLTVFKKYDVPFPKKMSGYFARIKALENDLKIILQNLDSGDRIIPGMKASGDSVHAMLGALRELKLHLRTDDYIAMSEIPSLIYSLNKGMKEFFVSINKLKSLPEVKSQYDKVSKIVESGEADKELKDSLASLKKFLNSEDKIIEIYSSYYLIVKKILNIFRFIQISE